MRILNHLCTYVVNGKPSFTVIVNEEIKITAGVNTSTRLTKPVNGIVKMQKKRSPLGDRTDWQRAVFAVSDYRRRCDA